MSLMSLKKQKGIEKLANKSGLNLTGQEARPDTDCSGQEARPDTDCSRCAAFRAKFGGYMPMTRFFYLPLLFCSFAHANEVKFENCEPTVCEALFEKAEVGFPIVFGENLTGKTLKVPKAEIGKVIQHGKSFTVCEGTSRIYTIKYQCLKNTECMFITNGSYKNARTKFEQCI